MEKIEYGDVNKFLVSIGLVLIALSLALPYLFLKEDFGIYIEVSKILKLQTHMQMFVMRKQAQVAFIQKAIPFISIILFLSGIILSQWGLRRWFKRQRSIDEKFDTDLEKSKLELTAMTPLEVAEKAQNEVKDIETEGAQESVNTQSDHSIINYLKIEERVYNLFKSNSSKHFDIHTQIKLGQTEIDILMTSKSSTFVDRIIEIKYISVNFNSFVVEKYLIQLNKVISNYKQNINRNAVPVLFIVYEPMTFEAITVPVAQAQVLNWASIYTDLRRLKVAFVAIDEIEAFDINILLKR